MKNVLTITLLFFFHFYLALTFNAKVVYVSDGDTFHVLKGNEKIKIRLAYVDCPERLQEHGLVAKAFVFDRIKDKVVEVNTIKKDRYGRTIASIKYDGKDLAEQLLIHGHAWHYKQYSKSLKLQKLEDQAKKEKKGLWKNTNPTPPWEYRWNKKNN